jgi:hypothetical protein
VTLGDAQAQEQEERDRLIEAFARRQSLNEELLCSEEEFLTLRQAVARYRSPADWSAIREQLDRCAQHKRTGLQDTALRLQSERNVLQKEYDALDRIRRQILSNPEPVPPAGPRLRPRAFNSLCRASITPRFMRRLTSPGAVSGGQRPAGGTVG